MGRICSTEILVFPLPATLAAIMNSSVQRLNAAPLDTLAKTGILNIPMARIALNADGPNTAVISIAMTREGKAKTRSLLRMIKSSNILRLFAAAAKPNGTPTNIPIPTATRATLIDVLAPTMIMDKISRPK